MPEPEGQTLRLQGWNFQPNPLTSGRREGLEIELLSFGPWFTQSCLLDGTSIKTPENPGLGSFLTGDHRRGLGGWCAGEGLEVLLRPLPPFGPGHRLHLAVPAPYPLEHTVIRKLTCEFRELFYPTIKTEEELWKALIYSQWSEVQVTSWDLHLVSDVGVVYR